MAQQRPTRAYLAVPAHRARLVAKAAASMADAVFMDLEDAVPPSEKSLALGEAVQSLAALDWGNKRVTVRINAVDSPFIGEEIRALAALPRLDALIVPKAERAGDIAAIAEQLRAAAPDRAVPVTLELLIETALGLVNVDTLAAAHDSVAALHLGVGDFAASIGARTSDIGVSPDGYRHVGSAQSGYATAPLDLFAYPMMRLLVAARARGLLAIDGPCGAFRDERLTEGSAQKAAVMGFDGKQVIHPDQIEPTLRAFTPSAAELEQARRIVEAMEQAEANGQGAVTLDGKMIDYANVRMARRIIALGS
ncbi:MULTISPECIES: HpcH/HpaI aldolase/citrate lyase family protein [unclassified Bradyrhizobium]|uniref:HpcH/HpaI aldolase/citrate lyase family protein n=1 Tax=unclassified Bradyrhizobium TaxID=2631580 RepID=UPI00211E8348|nr:MULTISPECIES: CoA ester lyase [unclassified Bradyrhizobium]MDD1537259.1 CoA ester lyase [Bradyrhizobium sp. WBOS8]MDD1586795.1 CoA ester lyase [Bradyrhizobium sp. WBOS4]UUO45606.1 CoA ester lyase [Bradyrhizobium sp. WBOS04]UUO59222.1 CoA ester lyase [Bradyrhizobium sp. WBOS08]